MLIVQVSNALFSILLTLPYSCRNISPFTGFIADPHTNVRVFSCVVQVEMSKYVCRTSVLLQDDGTPSNLTACLR